MSTEYVCNLSPDLIEKAKNELNEDPKRRAQDIQILREWIHQQPHLKSRTDDAFLLRFLRVSKFSIERAKERIDKYYTMRSALPEWFTNRDPFHPKMQELLNSGSYFLLPGYDDKGRRTIVMRIGKWNTNKIDADYVLKMDQMISDLLIEDEHAQICGINRMTDVSGCTGGHISSFTFPVLKKTTTLFQNVNPFRVGTINMVNESAIFQTVISMCMLLLSEKIKQRFFSHGKDLKNLQKVLPPKLLPVEYGGTAGKVEDMIQQLKKNLENHRDQYIDDDQYGVDESKRPGKPRTIEDLFGIDGTFRKLNID